MGLGLGTLMPTLAHAQSGRALVQILDTSGTQQETARDYSTGWSLAWAKGRQAGGLPVLRTLQTDGTERHLHELLSQVQADRSVVGLAGCAGETCAARVAQWLIKQNSDLPLIAPWLADDRYDTHPLLHPLFPSRTDQLRHALTTLQQQGLKRAAVVYAQPELHEWAKAALGSQLQLDGMALEHWAARPGEDVTQLAQRLPYPGVPFYVFLGDTLALARFTRVLAERHLERIVVTLADIDANLLQQVGYAKSVPLVLSQVVPNPQKAKLPVVQDYQTLLRNLFDEAPGAMSLAGYLAGRYATTLCQKAGAALDRRDLAAAARTSTKVALGGFDFLLDKARRRNSFLEQNLLGRDGKLVG